MLDIVRHFLDGHTATDASEIDSLARIRALLDGPGDPFSRNHFEPGHLTASGIVLNEERTKTLLIFHTKLQRWLQPGGHFEPGETDPSVAAAREVLEETGLSTRWPGVFPRLLDVDVHLIPARKTDPAHYHFDLRMLLIANEESALKMNEVSAVKWAAPGEFTGLNLDPGTVRALAKCGV